MSDLLFRLLVALGIIIISPLLLLPVHFLTVMFDLPLYLRPYTVIKLGGDWVSYIVWHGLGTVLGWLWYQGMRFAAFVRDVVLERLWPTLLTTLTDLTDSLTGYFDFSAFYEAVKAQVYDFWVAHAPSIAQGTTALVATVFVIFMGVYWWKYGHFPGMAEGPPVVQRKVIKEPEGTESAVLEPAKIRRAVGSSRL